MTEEKQIFIVEDNEKNMELFKAVLGTIPNLNILTSITGKEGLQSIASNNIDVIILDIQLPDMSGIDICKEIRKLEKYKKTPIMAVTSFAMKGDKERILNSGFNDYISKPLQIKEFRELVIKYLE
ncbi:response regulator [Promethearchaeum syntrophicum]|uniref:Response regulator n=1 Tax=Promethearchaeum syntrophicum TaxID=2594042 RepID=A0A5B9DBU6_9ARCH|nr:response regulator [Candidatus Prometheoarchaeum syntrophicum]